MRTNGFIYLAMIVATSLPAGQSGYLRSVGPLPLHFRNPSARFTPEFLIVPPETASAASVTATNEVVARPVDPPTPAPAEPSATTQILPVLLPAEFVGPTTNAPGPLIGPLMDTNGVVTPQVFLRFFTPPQGGVSKETILVPSPGFSPAQPPAPSSTARFSKPTP